MIKAWHGIMVFIVASALLACAEPCQPIPDPDCDWNVPNHHCTYLCKGDASEEDESLQDCVEEQHSAVLPTHDPDSPGND